MSNRLLEDDKAYLRYSFKLFVQRNCHEDEQEDMAARDTDLTRCEDFYQFSSRVQ